MDKKYRRLGWITLFVWGLTIVLTKPFALFYEWRPDALNRGYDKAYASGRLIKVDIFVTSCLVIECALFAWAVSSNWALWIPMTLAFIRVADIVATAIRISLFDPLELKADRVAFVASHARIVILSMINYAELILCFAIVYASAPHLIAPGLRDWFDPIYFSTVSQLTVGYGDLQPIGWLRAVVCVQVLSGLTLLSILLARFMSSLRPYQSMDNPAESDD
ncbi:MAG: potassium channel family protein [Armatimonadota bacterium]